MNQKPENSDRNPGNLDRKLRVLLFTDSESFAGTERHMLELASGLRDVGVAVSLACPLPSPLADKARQAKLTVQVIPKQGLVDWAAVQRLAALLSDGSVDIIHAHNGRTGLAAALAVRRAGRGHCVMTQHFLEPNHASQRGLRALVSRRAHHWVMGRMSGVIAISEAVKAAMLARREVPAGKITVVPNGISPPESGLAGQSAAVRQSMGIPADAPLVVCTARLEPEKDIAALVCAMGQVRAAVPTIRCLVAGSGSQLAALQEQILSLDLSEVVTLLGFRSDVPALLATANLLVLPSLAEPFGLAILEAMALGKPVVATAAGGPLEIVEDGKTGLLVPPSSPDRLAQAIVRVLSDVPNARKMGIEAESRYQAHFTTARMSEATLAVYQKATMLSAVVLS